eukprot:438575-Pelagomonas_calceolata.AAC.2
MPTTAAATAAAAAAGGSLPPSGSSSSTPMSSHAASAAAAAGTCISQAANEDEGQWGPGGSPAAEICAHIQAGKQRRQESQQHPAAAKGELSLTQAEAWVGHLLAAMAVAAVAVAVLHIMTAG